MLTRTLRRTVARRARTQRFATLPAPPIQLAEVVAVDPGDGTPGTAFATVEYGDVTYELPSVGGYLPPLGATVPLLMNGADPISLLQGVMVDGDMQSRNYVPGVSGWKIDSEGNVEFNTGTFRADIVASSFKTAANPVPGGSIEMNTGGGTNTITLRKPGALEAFPAGITAAADSLKLDGPGGISRLNLYGDGDAGLRGNDTFLYAVAGGITLDAPGSTGIDLNTGGTVRINGTRVWTSPPMFKAYRTTTQAPTAGTWQALTHTVVTANEGFTIVSGNRYRADNPGWYRVTVNVEWTAGGSQWFGIGVSLNGGTTPGPGFAPQSGEFANAILGPMQEVTRRVYMNGTTDYVQALVFPGAARTCVLRDIDIEFVRP